MVPAVDNLAVQMACGMVIASTNLLLSGTKTPENLIIEISKKG